MRPTVLQPILAGFLALAVVSADLRADVRPSNDSARFITRTEPIYPDSLRDSLSRGFVSLMLIINQNGRVEVSQVLRATHPDFVAPTLQALKSWRFEPALRNGHPTTVMQMQNIWFDIRMMASMGSIASYSFGIKPVPNKESPDEYKHDQDADVVTVVNPVYPYELAVAGLKGTAQIEFVVGPRGTVVKTSVLNSTRPELGEALEAMAQACHINPALKNGRPQESLMRRLQVFGPGENYLTYNRQTKMLLKEINSAAPNIAQAGELDAPLKALYQPGPVYPLGLPAQGIAGKAMVEFLVDHDGQAQLPRIIDATNKEFGWAAATAVQQWVFEKPTRKGQPAFVRVQVPIEFKAQVLPH